MERWSAVTAEDVHLATVRVYNPPPDKPNEKTRIILFLPPNRDPNDLHGTPPLQHANRPVFDTTTSYTATGPEPDCYELDMVNESVENQIVVAERPKDPSLSVSMSAAAATPNTRARTTILTGRIKHECNLRPAFSANYRKQMKERHRKYNTPTRQIKRIETANLPGGMGAINRLSSGVGLGTGNAFGDLVVCRISITQFFSAILAYIPENETKAGQGYL
jgi:transcription initiation factor TFIIF subunit beta